MPQLLDIIGTGGKFGDGNFTAGIGAVRPRNQRGAGGIGVNPELSAGQVLAVLRVFGQADGAGVQLVIEADRSGAAAGNCYLLGIRAGTGVQSVDGTVGVPQLLHIVSASGQPGNGNLAAAVGGVRSRRKAGAGRVGVHGKPPVGKILPVLRGFRQADCSRIRGFQLEIGIEIATGSAGEGYRCLITGTRHIPNVIGGVGSGGQIPGRLENSRGRNRAGLGDVQSAAALIELRSISVCEREVGENAVTVIDAGFFSRHRDSRSAPAGCGSETGNFLCRLNVGHQRIVVGSKIVNRCRTGIVEDISSRSAFISGIQGECAGVTQTADNLINEELGCDSQRHIGIVGFGCGGHADRVIPHLVAVQQDQANGFPSCGRQSVPHIAASGAATAVQGHIPVNRVAGGAGRVAAPRLNAVQGVIRIGNTAIPCKVPAQILDVRSPGGAGTIRFVGTGNLRVQNSGVIAVISKVKQHNTFLGAADSPGRTIAG